jgi:hypothetical protein
MQVRFPGGALGRRRFGLMDRRICDAKRAVALRELTRSRARAPESFDNPRVLLRHTVRFNAQAWNSDSNGIPKKRGPT